MKKFMFIAAMALAAAFVSCNREGDDGKEEFVLTTSDATTVCINEVCGVVGSKGVELYNPTDQQVSLEGWTLVKNEAKDPEDATKEVATWTGKDTDVIKAKGYFVITSKKEFDNIKDVANAKAGDSFSPSKTLKLELKNKGTLVDTFDRGYDLAGKTEISLKELEGSCARQEDGKKTWKVMAITMGKTNNGAEILGNVDIK
jgi:hypothetical protein